MDLQRVFEATGRVDWAATGVAYPADFRAFVDRHGLGGWDAWRLAVFHAKSESRGETHYGRLRNRRDREPGRYPYAFHPEPGGLLHWASGNRLDLFWDTARPNPEEWRHHGRGFAATMTLLLGRGLPAHPAIRRYASPASTAARTCHWFCPPRHPPGSPPVPSPSSRW
ncbi:hypothetical protein Afil01_40050 [Actinorhabdospora filicis]|uniref:SMI1/KNR4 family protein n=1 Tax=Actinorhabdospora filicis TaxID=1785913 RepID=A0A9W6SNG3_9ACTN|nr:hypothetical protein [Actinorhabdospora filicis]GLZ79198.1 hypothetical protein Afil01_40050 [Actinorhabdospora filicis]